MILVASEKRLRTKHVENTQAQVIDLLKRKDVARDLGSRVGDLLSIAEGIYLPNIRNNVISLPKKYRDTDNTPVVGIMPGETLKIDSTAAGFAPQQASNMSAKLEALLGTEPGDLIDRFDKALINAVIEHGARENHLPEEKGVGGFGSFSPGEVILPTFKLKMRFTGRLVLFLGMRDYSALDNSTVLVHEIAHVKQHTQNPLFPFEKAPFIERRLRDELEAYHLGRIVGSHSPKLEPENPAFDNSVHIDNIRQRNTLSTNPYEVTNLMAKVALISLSGARNGWVNQVCPEE